MPSIRDLVIRMQPYPEELKELCRVDSGFADALKSTHPEKFISLGAVVVSRSTVIPEDQVIGFFVYDYGARPMFKQDFIVNKGARNKEFVIYTRYPSENNKYIKDISLFYEKYSDYPKKTHHPSCDEIPDLLKPRALEAIGLAEKIISNGWGVIDEISEEEFARIDGELRKLNL